MTRQIEDPAEEIKRLRRCINDLVSVLALPAIWTGGGPSQVVGNLLDALMSMLNLEFIYARLGNSGGSGYTEMMRIAPTLQPKPQPQEISERLRPWLAGDSQKIPPVVSNFFDGRDIALVSLQLGLHGEMGVLVAGSARSDFPQQTERLVLNVAANQAAIGLQESNLLSAQKQLARELDGRVAQRTAELAAINEELKRSEAHKAAILDSSLDCIVAIDHEGRITEFNPAAQRTFGYPRESVIGKQLADVLIPHSLREKHRFGFTRHLATGESRVLGRRLEMKALCADGREIPVEIAITRIQQDGPPCFTGDLRDITERKRNEHALQETHAKLARSEERWRSVFENSAIGVALTDLNGRYIAANPVFQKMLGYTEHELEKLSFLDITVEEDRATNWSLVKDLLEGKRRQFQIEKQYRRKDGSTVWVRNSVSVVPGTERVPQFLMALSEDVTEQHEAKAALQKAFDDIKKSETKLRQVIEAIPTLAWCNLPDGSNEFLSKSWHEYTGLGEEAHGWGWQVAFHPDDLPALIEKWQKMLLSEEPGKIEARIRRHDGAYRWFLIRAEPFRDEEGKLVRWYGTSTDIDDRKRAEEALKVSESRFRAIIDTIPTMAWSANPDGYCDFVNRRWLEVTGLSDEQAQGWGWGTSVHGDDLSGLVQKWQTALASGELTEAEARMRRFDGTYRWFLFRANPLRDESGKIVKWYGTNIDIDERKQAEDQLRRNEDVLAKGQRLSLTGSFSWCVDTNEIMFSDEAYRIFEFDRDSAVTMEKIADRVHPEDRGLLAAKNEEARGPGGAHDYEMRLRMPNGSVKFLRTMSSDTKDINGRREYIGVVQDVTQWRLTEDALNKARSELYHVARITALSALTASIAHEVNQPLSGIVTNAGTCLRMLDANPPNLEGARETVRRTLRDGNRASEVITRLRALFSRKAGTFEIFDLNGAAEEVIALLMSDLQRNRVILKTDLASDLAGILGDRIQVQQVILNLVRNASDAMRGVYDRPRELLIRTERDESGGVRLSVKDSGVGIDPESESKLFEPFHTTKSDGMGIGLSISRSIMESHRGRLWAIRNDGPGATFTFSIPCSTNT